MSYPTSPSQVGLTVDKSTLTFDATTSYSSTQTVTGKYFRSTVNVTGGGAVVTFIDCWFYGGGNWSLSATNGAQGIVTNCEFGISTSDSTAEDPNGFIEADHLVDISITGNIVCSESYFHHAQDFVRLSNGVSYTRCYLHDHVVTETSHADSFQSTGTSNWTVSECYVDNNIAADVDLGGTGINRAFHIAPDFGPIENIEISNNYIDGEGLYTFAVHPFVTGSVTGNRFSDKTNPIYPGTFGPAAHITHSDNRVLSTMQSLDNEDGITLSERILQIKNFDNITGESIDLSLDSVPGAGNLVVCCWAIRNGTGQQTVDIGDFTRSRPTDLWSSGTQITTNQMYLVSDGVTNLWPVSWDLTGGQKSFVVLEVAYPAETDIMNVQGSNLNNGTAATSWASPSITTTIDDTVVLAWFATRDDHNGVDDWTNSYIELLDDAQAPDAFMGVALSSLVLESTASTGTTASGTSANRHTCVIVAYSLGEIPNPPASGGGYTPPPPSRRLASPYTRERKGNPFKGFSV